jgi:hypothetical protein
MAADPRMRARRHARRRAAKRLGWTMNQNRRAELLAQMLNGTARFLGTGHVPTRTQWICQYAGCKFRVVFCERLREIVTVIPWGKE